ncbi:MAG: type II toxin-antitoxin system MqsA family antitoxin [Gemmatimonadota bacterium]
MKTKRRKGRTVLPDGTGSRERRTARRLPDDACPTCGTTMRKRRGTLSLPVNGEAVRVPGVPHLHCPSCGENLLSYEEAGVLEQGALALYRARHHLLTGDEIRTLRKRLGLTQAALARLLRLGANTLSRWEAGRNVQTAAMDVLLRLLRDVPGSLAYLKRHAA